MRILICDDDLMFTNTLRSYVYEYFKEKNLAMPEIKAYDNGSSLLADPDEKDLVFLDVEMPGLDGISVGNRLSGQNPSTLVIIISSFDEYLDDAMRFHVFRYLSKPLDKIRLFRNLSDALQVYVTDAQKLAIPTAESVVTVRTADIIYVEALNQRVWIHTVNGDYRTTRKMSDWLEILTQPCFFYTYRSFIVNMAYVTSFDHETICLAHTDKTAYLTKRRYREFKAQYLLYLEYSR